MVEGGAAEGTLWGGPATWKVKAFSGVILLPGEGDCARIVPEGTTVVATGAICPILKLDCARIRLASDKVRPTKLGHM